MTTYHLTNWSTVGDDYTAPEVSKLYLSGLRVEDGRTVTTSAVVSVNGREITTYSGSVYILEDISPDYLQFLDKIGVTYDPVNPIKIRKLNG